MPPPVPPKIDIYPKSRTPALDPTLFQNPTAEYRGAPFWAWNCKLDKRQLLWQIETLKEMGMGGFHIHSRTGTDTLYLGPEFMDLVKACNQKAKAENMLCWLYDEDRWPSGAAGGLVTKYPQHRAKHLLFTPKPYAGKTPDAPAVSMAAGMRAENGTLLARYEVLLHPNGTLAYYQRLAENQSPSRGGQLWYAYLETATPSSWYNNQSYVDTLSPAAIKKFVEITHEAYYKAVGEDFGKSIPAIFTDEPQFPHKHSFNLAHEAHDAFIPFTTDLPQTFEKTYHQKLEDVLPEIFWELPDKKASAARYRYHDHIAERFAAAFADTCGQWCAEHHIALTGHMMEEPTLQSQTAALGEAMRSYRSFQLPGIDMLCDWREYTTAKQAQSACHQFGLSGVMSELYGVTNWDFDFVGHKAQGDWQAALGVTLRVPHLSWVSMAGEAKRDYPAAISYQSPWYKEYPLIENHFARTNTVLTRGTPAVRVGVIHPVESYWLCFGPLEQTKMEREERENNFSNITSWLLFGLTDFNFICESLLPSQCPSQSGNKLTVGQMAYDAVIVPALRTIRATTLDRLEKFAAAGGKLIFAGEIPSLVDAIPTDRAQKLAAQSTRVPFTRPQILEALESVRDLEIKQPNGAPIDSILSQTRIDGPNRHVFLCNTDRQNPRDHTRIRFKGDWSVTRLDTFTGKSETLESRRDGDSTLLDYSFPAHGSLLVTLTPGWKTGGLKTATRNYTEIARLTDPVPVTLHEPNVLLLDQAEARFNDGPWQPLEEILRIDNNARAHFGLKPRAGEMTQPWADTAPSPVVGTVTLRFNIQSEIAVEKPTLALEGPEAAAITLNGKPVPNTVTGWWVDEAIKTVALPPLKPGDNELLITITFHRRTQSVEWCYLLGDFGVEVLGRRARITQLVRTLTFGDFTRQGLPFYAGNLTYHCTFESTGQDSALQVRRFKSPLLSVTLDEKPAGKIAFAPFELSLGKPAKGPRKLDITLFGNRINAFGAVHNIEDGLLWFGPGAWRSTGPGWSYEYQLKPMGLIVSPIIKAAP